MDLSKTSALIPMWGLMTIWLCFVAVSVILAFQRWQKTSDSLKRQMLYLWTGATIVFVGDFLHTIAATISTYTGDPTGSVNIFGSMFKFRTFAMFFDALVFMVYYLLWDLFIVTRYQQGKFKTYDKIIVCLAAAAIIFILPGAVPNAFGIYTLDYDIAIWAPHMIFFIIFGVMTVSKLINCSLYAGKQTTDLIVKIQERALTFAGIGFSFSFLFFALFLTFRGIFMIPKTFAYMFAFFYLIKGVILPTSKA